MPNRPTKEFWEKTFPKVYKHYRKRNHARASRVTASIWYKKLKPKTRSRYEKIRRKRERR